MTYAHITTDGTIGQVGRLPALWFDGTRWHDWRGGPSAWATQPADWGWLPVAETPRPADTATTTTDHSVALVAGVPTVTWTPRPWTAEELAANAEQAARLDDLAARVARIEAHLWPAPDDPTTPDDPTVADWAGLGGIWPNEGLLREGGIIWRNVSGVPLTAPPSGFPGLPGQWGHLFVVALAPAEPAPPTVTRTAWSATATYKIGDEVTRSGRAYRCLVAHGSAYQGTWGPPTTGVWLDIGPA